MKKYSKTDASNLWNSYFRYHGYAYDGIWTIAKAIDAVERENNNESLVDFKYKWVELDLTRIKLFKPMQRRKENTETLFFFDS